MFFYKVWVASAKYHKAEPLTYSSEVALGTSEVIEVSLKSQNVVGIVSSKTSKPSFKVKPILRSLGISLPDESLKLMTWLLYYYPAPSGQIVQLFLTKNLPKKIKPTPYLQSKNAQSNKLPKLTEEQSSALKTIEKNPSGTVLLHGNTGTGKTRVYVELAKKAIKKQKSVIILTPEIGLTPQIQKTLKDEFGDRVILSHSHLTESRRRDIWLELASNNAPRVVVGPRSALFLPISNLGLIVIDEAHDNSYKQEQTPHYQTTRVAAKLANLHGCIALLGTATPLVADYYSLRKNKVPIIRMLNPTHKKVKQPKIEIIDRTDKQNFTNSWLFCNQLLEAITHAKSKNLISLIFLNRRGTARIVLCQQCSWQADCPNCDLPLTYHSDSHQLRCHICNFKQQPPLSCPVCKSTEISFHAAGTKALEEELMRLMPQYKLLRIDSDSSDDNRLEEQYTNIFDGKVDIIIGTQMITKGLDLPNLGVVGIPFADSSLYLPDYTADEQTFQLLTQVTGRVGRTDQNTEVIIQTYVPKQAVIEAVKNKGWDTFYDNQIKERSAFGYPPFKYLLQLTASRKQESTLQKSGVELANIIKRKWPKATVLGPAPRFHRKVRGSYQWQIIVKSDSRDSLLKIIESLPSGWRYNIDPTSLL